MAEGEGAVARLQAGLAQDFRQDVRVGERAFHYIHTFSHRKWDISFYQCECLAGDKLPTAAHWLSSSELTGVPWAGPHHKVVLAYKNTPNL